MNSLLSFFRRPARLLAVTALLVPGLAFSAQDAPVVPAAPTVPEAPAVAPAPQVPPAAAAPTPPRRPAGTEFRGGSQAIVVFGRDALLERNELADAVVAIGGSARADGTVRQSLVAITGDALATGPVGEAVVAILGNATAKAQVRQAVVAIGGNARVEDTVGENVVAVLGNVELGPNAVVQGNVVSIGGAIQRAPGAVIRGDIQSIGLGQMPDLTPYRGWLRQCLLYGRPLAFSGDVSWAWGIAAAFLLFYVVLGLLARGAIETCLGTLRERPGRTILATLLALILTPLLSLLVTATGFGLFVMPLLLVGVLFAGLFGRAVLLAAIGRTLLRPFGGTPAPVVGVVVGGVLVALLYTVPVAGFLLWKFLGAFGFGLVVYTLILGSRRERPAPAGPAPFPVAPPVIAPVELAPPMTPGASAPLSVAASGAAEATAPRADGTAAAAPSVGAAPQPAGFPVPPPPAAAWERAGFWRRIFALALDALLIGLLVVLFFSEVHGGDRVFLPALAVYAACLWRLRGTTIGGIILGLKVVRLDDRPMDWTTSVVRALSCFLSLVVAFLGFIWIAFDAEKQAWHDKIAGTIVVRAPRGLSLI
jgi:uncharacterized RDD family membrane protein YckC